jgi:hypothetical protein
VPLIQLPRKVQPIRLGGVVFDRRYDLVSIVVNNRRPGHGGVVVVGGAAVLVWAVGCLGGCRVDGNRRVCWMCARQSSPSGLSSPGRNSDGKNDPVRSFGIRSSRSHAVVDSVRERNPLRCADLASMRSCEAAPATAVNSVSIRA